MLTETQINNIHKLSTEDLLQIMHECAEALGCVSVKEYQEIMNMPKRTIYSYMKQRKIDYFEISGHFFPAINSSSK